MADSRYRRRLEKDIDRWIGRGLVPADSRAAILGDIGKPAPGWSASGALAILGAVLLALAAISFVAANWTQFGNGLRLGLIFTALWTCLLAAGWALQRKQAAAGHALALLGAALFGVAIVLVAQIFHMSSWRYTVLAVWAVGALGVALAIPSRPVLILAALLGAAWVAMESANPYAPPVIWSYLPLWALTLAAAAHLRSQVSANLLAIGLLVWIAFLIWDYGRADRLSELQLTAALILASGAVTILSAAVRDRGVFGFGTLASWGAALALVSGFVVQFPLDRFERFAADDANAAAQWLEITGSAGADYWILAGGFAALLAAGLAWRALTRPSTRILALPVLAAALAALCLPLLADSIGGSGVLGLRIVVGLILFALATALILYGSREGRRFVGGLGIVLFIAETLYVYGETFGDLLDTSLFFLIGGLILFGLSVLVIRLQGRFRRDPGDAS